MKKIVLILVLGLTLAIFAPDAARAAYFLESYNPLFSATGEQDVNANKCSVDNFCLCTANLKESDVGGLAPKADIFFSGNFKQSGSPFVLYSVRAQLLQRNTNALGDRFYAPGEVKVNLTVDASNRDCVIENKIAPGVLADFGPNTTLPSLKCQYVVAVGYGCCCANNPDGSVECGDPIPKVQKGAACELTCPNATDSKYEVEGADCSAHKKKAYVSKSTANIDLKSIRAEAALQLNPLKWLNKLPGPNTPVGQINKLIGTVIKFLMMAIGSLLLLFYVYAGFLWMTAQGNAEAITKAKTILFWSTLAIVVQLFAGILVSSVFGLLTTG